MAINTKEIVECPKCGTLLESLELLLVSWRRESYAILLFKWLATIWCNQLPLAVAHYIFFLSTKLDGVSTQKDVVQPQDKARQILSLWAMLGDGSQVGCTICWLGVSWYHFRIPLHVAQSSLSLSSESIFSCFHYRKWLALFSGLIRRGNMSCLLLGCLEVRVRKHLSISRACSVYFSPDWQGSEQR